MSQADTLAVVASSRVDCPRVSLRSRCAGLQTGPAFACLGRGSWPTGRGSGRRYPHAARCGPPQSLPSAPCRCNLAPFSSVRTAAISPFSSVRTAHSLQLRSDSRNLSRQLPLHRRSCRRASQKIHCASRRASAQSAFRHCPFALRAWLCARANHGASPRFLPVSLRAERDRGLPRCLPAGPVGLPTQRPAANGMPLARARRRR